MCQEACASPHKASATHHAGTGARECRRDRDCATSARCADPLDSEPPHGVNFGFPWVDGLALSGQPGFHVSLGHHQPIAMPSSSSPHQRAPRAAGVTPSSSCALVRTQLDAMVDGELSDKDDAMVRTHVASCTACRQLEQSLRQLLVTIAGSDPHVAAPRRLRLRVAHMLSEIEPTPDA